MDFLSEALWALKAALAKLKKTIICNKTGGTYACGTDSTKCFCDASNSERFGGGPGAGNDFIFAAVFRK